MTTPMYSFAVPAFRRALVNLDALLGKADAWATARKIDPNALLLARLAPDMFTLTRQVQIASDMAKNGSARLAAVEPPKFEDGEKSFAELRGRIARTLTWLDTLTPSQFEGAAGRDISFTAAGNPMQFKGEEYLITWLIPNLYFHVSMAYALLRHNGMEIGKRDFLGTR